MQSPQAKPPVGVIFDCDMSRVDDALALALLYGLDGKDEARVVSISVSKSNLQAAAFCEAVGRFYSGAVNSGFAALGRTLPIGLSVAGKLPEDLPMLTGPLSKLNDKGEPVYFHGIHQLNDTAEVDALIRNAFTSQHDQNAIVVLAGPATNLVTVLDLPGVKDLITRKVRYLALTGGAFPSGEPEFNIKTDVPAAKRLFAEWPTPIVASGFEVGKEILYPASSIENDFTWTANHPVVDAYRAYKPMPYDAPTWDMTTVLYAIRPNEGYFKLSEPGTITVTDDGRTKFAPSANGQHRHLIYDPAQKERILKAYTELASAKPVVRMRRRPPQQQQQQQQQEQKKQAAPPATPPAS
ncbi:MAG: nucleoside hydrolase [Bryobacteraceae bacterium]